ncbi:MAG: acylphosphatase [Salipiger thiooxidans]|uniref:acylphosphatase n=1 Tax=Salipiger thiooxidans TaxID=282683 RepID=UPI001CFA0087|nr:acylphosphatase [Salipiger thiooxidans]
MATELFSIAGQVDAPGFAPWIERHACRIGVGVTLLQAASDHVEIEVEGPPALLDAMEMGCLLGPIEVWVESIVRERVCAAGA